MGRRFAKAFECLISRHGVSEFRLPTDWPTTYLCSPTCNDNFSIQSATLSWKRVKIDKCTVFDACQTSILSIYMYMYIRVSCVNMCVCIYVYISSSCCGTQYSPIPFWLCFTRSPTHNLTDTPFANNLLCLVSGRIDSCTILKSRMTHSYCSRESLQNVVLLVWLCMLSAILLVMGRYFSQRWTL